MKHETDEVKLTAYALGELDETERREIEAQLARDAAAQHEVEELRRFASTLSVALSNEETPALVDPTPRRMLMPHRWTRHFASLAACLIVAASVAVALWYHESHAKKGVIPAFSATSSSAEIINDPISSAISSAVPLNPPPQTQPAAAVADLTRQTHDWVSKGQYAEALRTVDQILTLDPTNDYASGVRPLIEDRAKLLEQRRHREQFDRQFTRQLTQADDKEIPYNDILRWPSNWPDISDRRGNEPVFSSERQLQIDQKTHAALLKNGGVTDSTEATSAETNPAIMLTPEVPPMSETVSVNTANATVLKSLGDVQALYGLNGVAGIQRDDIAAGVIGGFGGPVNANDAVLLPMDDQDNDGTDSGRHFNTESYDRITDNPFLSVTQNPLSTFSIDVDTASYANLRRHLNQNQLPPPDAVRIEEMLNYFTYDYAPPTDDRPFASHVEVAACPWNVEHRLVRVALKGKEIHQNERPASNLVFLIDVSGSMEPGNKLPLLKSAMKMLVEQLGEKDRVAMVVYAGSSGMALPSTPATQKQKIMTALDQLAAGGSTNGAQGIELAYSTALDNFIKDGVNRVILCTDGDFNVGVTNEGDLTRLIEDKAKSGIFLSVLGFGMGNLKDSTMEKLADKGNGNYAYIDTINEVRKVLVEQMSGTLVTIAKDVKIQIEFNPTVVGAYRLIGYENRLLAKEDFNDDTKDAGEIGAGHAVTAMYEVVPAGKEIDLPGVDPLKYQKPQGNLQPGIAGNAVEMLTLKLRYKAPDGETSKLIEVPVKDEGGDFEKASQDFKFASAVAGFGMILRDSPHKGSADFKSVLTWAEQSKGDDASGYRAELIWLVQKAQALKQ